MKKFLLCGFAALLLVAFSVPAMADLKVGGIVFTDFYYYSKDKENKGDDDFGKTKIEIPSMTRLNARWTNEDNVGMYIELGLGGAGPTASGEYVSNPNQTNLRWAYGWWDVNPGFQVLAGMSTTPFAPLAPSQLVGTDSGGLHIIGFGYGNQSTLRTVQLRGTIHFSDNVRLAIAMVDADTSANTGLSIMPAEPGKVVDADSKIPRFDLGMPIYLGALKIYPSFLWQKETFDNVASGYDDEITSWAGSLGFILGVGPLEINVEGVYGSNMGNTSVTLGFGSAGNVPDHTGAKLNGTEIDDSKFAQGFIDLGFKLGVAEPHLIYGIQNAQGDDLPYDYTSQMYGVSIPIDLAKGFRLRPEFMWYDKGDENTDSSGNKVNNGTEQIYGVQFQITF